MKNALLATSALFSGISEADFDELLTRLATPERVYQKGEFVFTSGAPIHSIGLVLSGSVHIMKEDFWGNRMILGRASAGELFGEAYACLPNQPLEVSVMAAEKTELLLFDVNQIFSAGPHPVPYQMRLIENLLEVFAQKNVMLTRKMEHMAKRTTREKLLSYLSAESQKHHSSSFQIPFNRQQLADYLAVDRSAMSHELSKLREEGIIDFWKNHFQLNQIQDI